MIELYWARIAVCPNPDDLGSLPDPFSQNAFYFELQ
jgi:hypothetical protein